MPPLFVSHSLIKAIFVFHGGLKPPPFLRFLHGCTPRRSGVKEPNRFPTLANASHPQTVRDSRTYLIRDRFFADRRRRRWCASWMDFRSAAPRSMKTTASAEGNVASSLSGGGLENEERKHREDSRLLTIPTVLTLGRVTSIPLLMSAFYMDGWWATTATTSIFLVAAITDWLDGYIARKMGLRTTFGAFLDPVADKLMVATTLLLLCSKSFEVSTNGNAAWLLTVPSVAIIGREITMSAVREWAASQNSMLLEAVAVNNLGKWKTATQMTALTILLLARDPRLTDPSSLATSGILLLYISAVLALLSLLVYIKKIWRVLLK